ncbi:MAG: sugar phosphate isomerase/epimerase [Candidatus Manganitrophaceae bacterium]|nr:MAG: sugar phosphate isomerase/epimerase [Candidatus Manganitrophaceae bacterium]
MVQAAFSTRSFRNYSILEAVEQIAAAGYSALEITCDRPHADPTELSRSTLRRLQSTLARFGLKVSNLNTKIVSSMGEWGYPSWIEHEMAAREVRILHTIACIKLAEALGAQSISIPAGGPLNTKTREEDLDLFMDGLKRVLPHAEDAGLKIFIDAEPNFILSSSREILEWIGQMNSPLLQFYFDIEQFVCLGKDPFQALRSLSPVVGHIHFEHVGPIGTSADPSPAEEWNALSKILLTSKEIGYQGFVSLALYSSNKKPSELAALALEHFKRAAIPLTPPVPSVSPSSSTPHERSNGMAVGAALIHLPPTSSQ